jgi:hypothetical protein
LNSCITVYTILSSIFSSSFHRGIRMQMDNPSVSDGCPIFLFYSIKWNSQYDRDPMRNADEVTVSTIRLRSRSKFVLPTSARRWLHDGLFDKAAIGVSQLEWTSEVKRLGMDFLIRGLLPFVEIERFRSCKDQLKCRFYQIASNEDTLHICRDWRGFYIKLYLQRK